MNKALVKPGIALIDLKFPDANSKYLQDLVLGLCTHHNHGAPIEHSATRGWFWDVKPKEQTGHQARSESSLDFPWHTDCSYESRPPQFFALHVLHADRYGGGTLSALNALEVIRGLGPSTYQSLSRPEFRITVPPEFSKGTQSIDGSLVTPAEDGGGIHIRFRSDIVQPLSNDAKNALQQLNRVLESSKEREMEGIKFTLSPQTLPDNTIVLVDNSRWLHARTEVKDRNRHLRRLRWGRRQFGDGDKENITK